MFRRWKTAIAAEQTPSAAASGWLRSFAIGARSDRICRYQPVTESANVHFTHGTADGAQADRFPGEIGPLPRGAPGGYG